MSESRSREAQEYRHWYWTARWRSFAARFLREHPLCANCRRRGRVTPATVVHHLVPHRGDLHRFWSGPFEAACKACHDGPLREVEDRGYSGEVGLDGWPLDPRHPAQWEPR